jgi:hypothetical protein
MSTGPSFSDRLRSDLQSVESDVSRDEATVQNDVSRDEASVQSDVSRDEATVQSDVRCVRNTVQSDVSAVRSQVGSARPDAELAYLTADVVAKLPPSMQGMIASLPNVGTIGSQVGCGKPAVINSPEFGESSATPAILDVPVSAQQQGILSVGQKVHQKFFPDSPPFNFNVNFSCAKTDPLTGTSDYADPRSPWDNVFFGRYEIDCPAGAPGDKTKWSRPFGFVAPGSNQINFNDILKIGNSDWGYFSNWMYGVPEADLDKSFAAQAAGPKPTCTVTNPNVVINGKSYVECTVEGVSLPSAFVNPRDGKALTNNDSLMSPVWRNVFGKQSSDVGEDPSLANTPSFAPTKMKMKFYLRQELDPKTNTYKTLIYGGGVNETWAGSDPTRQAYNDRFLQAQMDAVKATMPPAAGPG